MHIAPSARWSLLARFACLAVAAVVLSGCVVVPAYRVHPYHYY